MSPTASNPTMPLATRTSARQGQRIQRRSQPQPRTPRISDSTAGWVRGGTKSEERKLLEKLVAYLYIDPMRDDDVPVLKFLRKDWPLLQSSLHTTLTMEKLKQALLVMKIPYLRQVPTTDPRSRRSLRWEYWQDYTPAGIRHFHEALTPTQEVAATVDDKAQQAEQSGTEEDLKSADGSGRTGDQAQSSTTSATTFRQRRRSMYRSLWCDCRRLVAPSWHHSKTAFKNWRPDRKSVV